MSALFIYRDSSSVYELLGVSFILALQSCSQFTGSVFIPPECRPCSISLPLRGPGYGGGSQAQAHLSRTQLLKDLVPTPWPMEHPCSVSPPAKCRGHAGSGTGAVSDKTEPVGT